MSGQDVKTLIGGVSTTNQRFVRVTKLLTSLTSLTDKSLTNLRFVKLLSVSDVIVIRQSGIKNSV